MPGFDVPLRLEAEFMFRGKNDFEHSSGLSFPYPAGQPPAPTTAGTDTFSGKQHLDVNIQTYMLNVFYDFYTDTKFTPYIGGGIGAAHISADNSMKFGYYDTNGAMVFPVDMDDSASKTNFAWNLGAGVAYAITDSVDLDLGYRYIDFGSIDFQQSLTFDMATGQQGLPTINISTGASSSMELTAHEVTLGVRISF